MDRIMTDAIVHVWDKAAEKEYAAHRRLYRGLRAHPDGA